jgi:hypothetical protein
MVTTHRTAERHAMRADVATHDRIVAVAIAGHEPPGALTRSRQ